MPERLQATVHCICLKFAHPQAEEVFVAGSLNDWRPAATPMIHLGQGRWVKLLALLPEWYQYVFVVDGQWRIQEGNTIEVLQSSKHRLRKPRPRKKTSCSPGPDRRLFLLPTNNEAQI
jgi:hypothetical protein